MARKPKPALATWLIDQRKAHGESVGDIARVTDRTEATVRGWEAGRPPSVDDPVIAHLERHWGAIAPKETALDQAGLAAALMALARELQASREERAHNEARLRYLEGAVAILGHAAGVTLPVPPVPDGTAG